MTTHSSIAGAWTGGTIGMLLLAAPPVVALLVLLLLAFAMATARG